MLVDPEPLLGMLPDDGFEAIPAGLHYLPIRGAGRELKGIQNPHRVAAWPGQCDELGNCFLYIGPEVVLDNNNLVCTTHN